MTAFISPRLRVAIEWLDQVRQELPCLDQRIGKSRFGPVRWFRSIRGKRTGKNWFSFPAGHVPGLIHVVESRGHKVQVRIKGVFESSRMRPASNPEQEKSANRDFWHLIQSILRAIFYADNLESRLDRIAEIARIYPQAKILVAVNTHREAKSVQRRLGLLIGEPIGRVYGRVAGDWQRCTVTTFHSLRWIPDRDVDVVLVPWVERGLGRIALEAVAWKKASRVYGFWSPEGTIGPSDQVISEAFYGPLLDFGTASRSPDVRVIRCSVPSLLVRDRGTALERKRVFLWQNMRRNELIAKLARAADSGDLSRLDDPSLLGHIDPLPDPRRGSQRRIVVLVESLEHAGILRNLLPEATRVRKAKSGEGTSRTLPREPRETTSIAILTTMAAISKTWTADVVIRASGEACVPETNASPPGGRMTSRFPLLIDVDNADERVADQEWQRRKRAYQRMNWRTE